MKEIIPYKKEILFNTKVAEISSISLEYEANVLDEEIAGDFIVSGEYKVHEVSVNKEPFKYRLPFSIELADSIIRDSLKYDIYDFTYEVKNDDTLVVNISFLVDAEEIVEAKEEVLEEVDNINAEEVNERNVIEEDNSVIDNSIKEEKKDSETNNIVMNNIENQDNTYVVYHVYVYNDNDTIDNVISKFNTSKDVIMEYNNTLDFKSGDKILIPELADE